MGEMLLRIAIFYDVATTAYYEMLMVDAMSR